ncbi:MAG: hypothetical protein K2W86_16625 [Sphingomonas sp.]|uniref:hypothetical protein n=1 Tax=Sphingomonas sp. TaxID=28214 RepID=UPI0035A97614|nr:hypothetical protein [Sphingomonas sp.]
MAQPPTPSSLPETQAPPKRAFGRSLSDFPNLSDAEKQLVSCCARGDVCKLGDGTRPEEQTAANTIRAELIRFLALGGDANHPVHEEGVMLRGGWIKGELSLHQAKAAVRLDLNGCHFDTMPDFTAARLPELGLHGSSMPGIRADRMTVTGSVFLCKGYEAKGEVRLLGSQIGGNLECAGGSFTEADGDALSADGVIVTGDVFLSNGFAAKGAVRLLGAQIGGDLSCTRGSFTNAVNWALNAERMSVAGTAFLRNAKVDGSVALSAARIATFCDDEDFWRSGGHIFDGLLYDRFIGPTDAEMRIKWLRQQDGDHLNTDFKPQPWEQLITVLRAMGHPDAAAEVAIAKQDQLRVVHATRKWTFSNCVNGGLHWFYGKLAGYGHRPIWTVYWMMGVCAALSLAFYAGRETGHFGPTSPLIHASKDFKDCGAPGEKDKNGKPKPFWTSPKCPTPPEYTTFQPFLYSLDLILPLVDLHQEADWAPLVVNPAGETLWPGRILRWMMWAEILFGWVASLTLVAVLGRLVDKD